MRTWLLPLLLLGCTGPAPAIQSAQADVQRLEAAVTAWQAEPNQASLERVSLVAGELSKTPQGERSIDLPLAHALSEILLRPDLARPRVEPFAADLNEPEGDLWLNVLLRTGDIRTFTAEAARLRGKAYDSELPALQAASSQAKNHLEVDWVAAGRAHDAAHLANQHVRLQRKKVDQPVPDLAQAIQTLARIHPDAAIQAVFTRATNTDDPDPNLHAGAIPAKMGRRRVVSFAENTTEFAAATEAFLTAAPPRTVGVVVQVDPAEGVDLVYCGEGRLEKGQFWMVSGCDGYREAAWLKATERYLDLVAAGRSEAVASETIRQRFIEEQAGQTP